MGVKIMHGVVALVAALMLLPGLAAAQDKSPSSAAGPGAAGQADVTIAADSLQGTKVYGTDGKELGTISKLLIDPKDGRVASVLIKQGGTAGLGGKEVSVPWDALKVQRGDRDLVVSMQRDLLERAQPSASPATEGKPSSPKQ